MSSLKIKGKAGADFVGMYLTIGSILLFMYLSIGCENSQFSLQNLLCEVIWAIFWETR